MLMATLLNSWGCRYEIASGGEAALKLLYEAAKQNDPFRVALLDHGMKLRVAAHPIADHARCDRYGEEQTEGGEQVFHGARA